MLDVGLLMMVKDEAPRIRGCLEPILDLFGSVRIVDTGSTDGTPDLLRELGVEPGFDTIRSEECWSFAAVRNRALADLSSPWVLALDADERLDRAGLERLLRRDPGDAAGYFLEWVTHLPKRRVVDYKLPLYRREAALIGVVHANVQTDMRRKGWHALWSEDVILEHHPAAERLPHKRDFYFQRIGCGLGQDPTWYRYHWFAGYHHFRGGSDSLAESHLRTAAEARSPDFPVEILNAHLVLVALLARQGRREDALAWARAGVSFHGEVAEDFEVKVNWRLGPALADAVSALEQGRLDAVQTYHFGS